MKNNRKVYIVLLIATFTICSVCISCKHSKSVPKGIGKTFANEVLQSSNYINLS
jgi:hypothetical protein